jgi:hypothetical protein
MSKSSKKSKKQPDKGKDITDLVETNLVDEVVTNIISHKKGSKRDAFYLYWILGLPAVSCARLAGYTKEYGYKLVQQFNNNSSVRERVEKITSMMPEKYRAICRLRLAEVADIEGRVLGKMRDNPELAARNAGFLKQIKMTSGVLVEDTPRKPVINVAQLSICQNLVAENLTGGDPLRFMDAIEGEVTRVLPKGEEE